MFDAPYDQLREMKDLGCNAEGETWFLEMEPYHKFFGIV